MNIDLALGAAIGGITGFVLAIPAIILETSRRVNNLPLILDVKTVWGKKLTDAEIFAVSLLLHLLVATGLGALYVFAAQHSWLFTTKPYQLDSIMLFAVVGWALSGAIVYPILGVGFFGRHEGKHIWFEMLITHLLLGFLFWLAVRYYQPFFF